MSSNPLLELMRQGESGTAGYDAYNRGTYRGSDGRDHIRGADHAIDFSSLTLEQVQAMQHRGEVFAVGKYQIVPNTMDLAVRHLNLDAKQAFTPDVQDAIFSQYLIATKQRAVHDYITSVPGVSLHDAQAGLAREWASFGDPDKGGASHYGGANHASITLAQSESALNQMRATYQADIARGLSPSQAWRDVTASDHARTSSPSYGAGHLQQQGDRGAAVHALQANLITLGYRDAHGHPLKADGDFGANTRHAVETFQRDHHLAVDGKVGPQTQHALTQAMQAKAQPAAALLNDARHPDHALYEQALTGVREIDAQIGRHSDVRSDNLAAALTVEACRQGLTRIDEVALSENGERAFAMQSGARTQMAHVQTAEAVHSSIAHSSAAWAQAAQQATAVRTPPQEVPIPQHATQAMGR